MPLLLIYLAAFTVVWWWMGLWAALLIMVLLPAVVGAVVVGFEATKDERPPPPSPAAPAPPIPAPPSAYNHAAWSAPRLVPARDLIQGGLTLKARIEYVDAHGEVTVRTVRFSEAYGVGGVVDRLDGRCSKRRAKRSFLISGILSLTDLDTGEQWSDAAEWFDCRRPVG